MYPDLIALLFPLLNYLNVVSRNAFKHTHPAFDHLDNFITNISLDDDLF
jgi:hypothetical protein